MKLYKALATAMVATAATMAAMPAGNAAVFYGLFRVECGWRHLGLLR